MLSVAQLKVRDAIYELIRKEYDTMDVPIPLDDEDPYSPESLIAHAKAYNARKERIIKRTNEMLAMLETLGLKRHA
jgi:hypothetical protein